MYFHKEKHIIYALLYTLIIELCKQIATFAYFFIKKLAKCLAV